MMDLLPFLSRFVAVVTGLYLMEDGVSYYLQEDGTSRLLLE